MILQPSSIAYLGGRRHRYRCDPGSGFVIPKSPLRVNDKDLEHPIAAAVAHVGAVPAGAPLGSGVEASWLPEHSAVCEPKSWA